MTELIIIIVCSFAAGALLGGLTTLIAVGLAAEAARNDRRARERYARRQAENVTVLDELRRRVREVQ